MMRCGCGFTMPGPLHGRECEQYEDFARRLQKEIEKEKQAVSVSASFEAWRDSDVAKEIAWYLTTDNATTAPHALALLLDAFLLARDKPTI